MVRKQWLWLFIWIFIFFSIFCIWSKLGDYKKTAPQKESLVENNSTQMQASQPKLKTIKKNMSLTLIKKGDLITISGNVPNKQTKDNNTYPACILKNTGTQNCFSQKADVSTRTATSRQWPESDYH